MHSLGTRETGEGAGVSESRLCGQRSNLVRATDSADILHCRLLFRYLHACLSLLDLVAPALGRHLIPSHPISSLFVTFSLSLSLSLAF